MKFELKGNYFSNKFIMPVTTGPDAVEHFFKRECPSDTSLTLWECPIEYRHVDSVIASAQTGYQVWRKISLEKRIEILKRYQEAVLSRQDEIAEAIAWEVGKPLWEAKTEAAALVAKVNVTISDSLPRIESKQIDNILPNTTGHIIFKPIGPSFIVGPFNFPCHLANGQILSALIAGNSIIFKPSEKTAYSCQLMIECFHAAGFPDGVINMIQGDGEIARRVLKSRDIKGVFFTGSKEVGKKILKQTHEDLSKLVSLELGGKNAAIVHKDANFDHALQELIKGAFLTTGQRCTSTALVIIHEDLKDKFIKAFHDIAKKIIVDHPVSSNEEPFMGPLIDKQSVDAYLLFMGMAKREGIKEIMRGKSLEKATQGHYVSPSIHLAESWDNESHFLASEIFGPNVTFIPYKTIEDAIDIANKTEYGLAASIFTADKEVYKLCLEDLDTGLINLNRSTVGASSKLPFGGVKNSGNYKPAAVTTIDACVYQLASLEIDSSHTDDISTIKGLKA